jgi:hypothetical protein
MKMGTIGSLFYDAVALQALKSSNPDDPRFPAQAQRLSALASPIGSHAASLGNAETVTNP